MKYFIIAISFLILTFSASATDFDPNDCDKCDSNWVELPPLTFTHEDCDFEIFLEKKKCPGFSPPYIIRIREVRKANACPVCSCDFDDPHGDIVHRHVLSHVWEYFPDFSNGQVNLLSTQCYKIRIDGDFHERYICTNYMKCCEHIYVLSIKYDPPYVMSLENRSDTLDCAVYYQNSECDYNCDEFHLDTDSVYGQILNHDLFPVPKFNDDENDFGSEIDFYPHPGTDAMDISFFSKYSDDASIMIYDRNGEIVKTQNITVSQGNNIQRLDISDLRNSEYFIKIYTGKEIIDGKFLINK